LLLIETASVVGLLIQVSLHDLSTRAQRPDIVEQADSTPAAEKGADDMNSVRIVTDSMCGIPAALCHELEITVVPLPLFVDDQTYLDSEVSPRTFYARLRQKQSLPKTSGPTPGSFKERFESLGQDGRPILAVLVGSQFSSTYSAAGQAKAMSSKVAVTLFDSGSNTLGLGFMALAAARAARAGMSPVDIVALLERLKQSTGVIFAVADLDYLRRGGRISHIERLLASTLRLVPILQIRNSPIQPVERVRTQARVIPKLIDLVAERVQGRRPLRVGVVHADAEPRAFELAKAVRERLAPDEVIISEITPVLGIHTGPGALGLAYSTGA
jgi:DegV family protein with EDD domain